MVNKPNFHFTNLSYNDYHVFIFLIFLATVNFVTTKSLFAQSSEDFQKVSYLNTTSILEPPGSKGTNGMSMGVSFRRVDSQNIPNSSLKEESSGPSHVLIPSFHLIKGIFSGIDLGISISYLPEQDLSIESVTTQWTFLESPRAYSFGTRITLSHLKSYESYHSKGISAKLLGSANILSNTDIYAGYTLKHDLTESQYPTKQKTSYTSDYYTLGLRCVLPSPFFNLTIEKTSHTKLKQLNEIKIKTAIAI